MQFKLNMTGGETVLFQLGPLYSGNFKDLSQLPKRTFTRDPTSL